MQKVGKNIGRHLVLLFIITVLAANLFPAQVNDASYSIELTEALALSDSVQTNKYSPRLESISLADSVNANKFVPRSESLSLSDALDVNVYRLIPKETSDSLSLSDSVDVTVYWLRSRDTSDSFSLSDMVSIVVYWHSQKELSENLFIGESISAEKFTPGTESLNFSDALSVTVYRFVPKEASESLSVGDVLAVNKFTPLNDNLSLSDEVRIGVYRPQEDPGLPVEYFHLWLWSNNDGVLTKTVTLQSNDKSLQLMILEGTRASTMTGFRLAYMSMLLISWPLPLPPENAYLIGPVYDLEPDGASFDNPVILTFTYDPARLPEGVSERDLIIAYYDESQGKWILLDSIINTVNRTITTAVTHFTKFSVLGLEPGPAVFNVADLVVSPQSVISGESVTISVWVPNTGGKEGIYNVILKVNNAKEDELSVTVPAGSTRQVIFTLLKEDAGSYIVDVDGLSFIFEVIARPAPPEPPETPSVPEPSPEQPPTIIPTAQPPAPEPVEPAPPTEPSFNWLLMLGITGGVIITGLLTYFLIRRIIWLRQGR